MMDSHLFFLGVFTLSLELLLLTLSVNPLTVTKLCLKVRILLYEIFLSRIVQNLT